MGCNSLLPFLPEVSASKSISISVTVTVAESWGQSISVNTPGLGLGLGLTLPDTVSQDGKGSDTSTSLGKVVSSSQLLGWGVVGGHSTVGVSHQGGNGEADSGDSKAVAVAQPWLSLSLTLAETMSPGAVDAKWGTIGKADSWGSQAIAVSEPWLGLGLSLTLPDADVSKSESEVGSAGSIGDGLGGQVVSGGSLDRQGGVRGDGTVGVLDQLTRVGMGVDGGDNSWDGSDRVSQTKRGSGQPGLSLSGDGGNKAGESSSLKQPI